MTHGVTVRIVPTSRISPNERRDLIALVNAAFDAHRWLFPDAEATDDRRFAEDTAGAELIILARQSRPVAMGFVRPEHDGLYLGMVAVLPAEQRRGLGTAVLREADRIARRHGLSTIVLSTATELASADYWARHGFSIVTERAMPRGTSGATADWTLVTMHRALPAET